MVFWHAQERAIWYLDRDPNLKETNEIYEGIPAYLEAFDPDERDMTKYVIGTISNLECSTDPVCEGQQRPFCIPVRCDGRNDADRA